MRLLDYEFQAAGHIDAARGPDGVLLTYTAYERYANPKNLRLNAHGRGPFYRLTLGSLPRTSGVYAITSNTQTVYVGIARDVAERWGRRGYSVIDPRNCYVGGQSTNCHVNSLIGRALDAEAVLELWVYEHGEPRPIERELLAALKPEWNVSGV